MNIFKKNKLKRFMSLAIAAILIIGFLNINIAFAGFSQAGNNKPPQNPGWAQWWTHGGSAWSGKPGETTDAWKSFMRLQTHRSTDVTISGKINELTISGSGLQDPFTGEMEKMSDSCKRSKYIYAYSSPGRPNSVLPAGTWNTLGNNVHDDDVYWKPMPDGSKEVFQKYLNIHKSTWNTGKVLLVCSRPLESNPQITIKAGMDRFVYDGQPKIINTWEKTFGELKSGHEIVAEAYAEHTNIGQYVVPFIKETKVIEKSTGKDVTSQYVIKSVPGAMKILGQMPLKFEAGSDQVKYNGNIQFVKTWKHLNPELLLAGHKVKNPSIEAYGEGVEIGEYPVIIKKDPIIIDEENKDVTELYSIEKLPGKLLIVDSKALVFKANSGTFKYDGSTHTVSGYKRVSGELSPGHTEGDIVAIGQRTDVGTSSVNFEKIEVLEGAINVTHLYKIIQSPGEITVEDDEDEDEERKEETDYWRCISEQSDSATAYVENVTAGSHGFTPQPSPRLDDMLEKRLTPAGQHAKSNKVPKVMSSKSSWDSWKSTFEAGSDEITPILNLTDSNVSETLTKFGGVYNVTKTLNEETHSVSHCQPQTREWIRVPASGWVSGTSATYNEDGSLRSSGSSGYYRNPAYWKWTPWEDEGGRIIWTRSSPSDKRIEQDSYQIFSVNCFKSGFQRIMSETGGTNKSIGSGDAGGLLYTKKYGGSNAGPLGRPGHETGTNEFYNEIPEGEDSCKEAFECTPKKLPSALNDANNNTEEEPLFTGIQDDGTIDKPLNTGDIYKDHLVFFRDHVDRMVRADVWYPKQPELTLEFKVDPPGTPANSTTAKIYGGTPEIGITTIAPWDNKENKLTVVDGETQWPGSINKYTMKSQWASDKDKPYELGLNWEYNAEITIVGPEEIDGYEIITESTTEDFEFEIYCGFDNAFIENSASIPDKPTLETSSATKIWNTTDVKKALKVLFTRSVSDTDTDQL